MDVNVRGVSLEVRTVKLTKALLKQCRRFKGTVPEPFRLPYRNEGDTEVRFNSEFTVGWFRGSVLSEEYDDFVLFARDGDLFLAAVPRLYLRRTLPEGCKQLYIV